MTYSPRPHNNAFAGIHKSKHDGASKFEAFEVFYLGRSHPDKRAATQAGWYWRPVPTPDLLEPDPIGPFTSSRAAYRDAIKQG